MDKVTTHSQYDLNAKRWEFYLRSYMGGQDYIDGKYLTQYIQESEAEYNRRLELTPMDNHCKNIVHILLKNLCVHPNERRTFGK